MNPASKGFRWVVAILIVAANWGVAGEASAFGIGGASPEPGGNTPSNYKLSGPAITGQMKLIQHYGESGPITGSTTLEFEGVCQGKQVSFVDQEWPSSTLIRNYTRYCSENVESCENSGSFVESSKLTIKDTMFLALEEAGCVDVILRNSEAYSLIKLFVQAVPYFRYDESSDVLHADVVLLFLVPVVK